MQDDDAVLQNGCGFAAQVPQHGVPAKITQYTFCFGRGGEAQFRVDRLHQEINKMID